MTFSSTSVAAGRFSGIKNVPQSVESTVMPRKILIIGTYDPGLTITDEVPMQILSADDAASKYGRGFMLHRLAMQAFKGSQGVPTYCYPKKELTPGSASWTGTFTFATGPTTEAGVIHAYVAGDYVPVPVAKGAIVADIGTALTAAITANPDLCVTAAGAATVTCTAKTKGIWGNGIKLAINCKPGQYLPAGITCTIVNGAIPGSGTPVLSMNGLGTGDNQNQDNFTDVINGLTLADTVTLDTISTYNGTGNDFLGNYAKEVSRPFRCLNGDTTKDAAGYAALVVIANGATRLIDRTNGVIAAPDSPNHPDEIAAQVMGHAARIASTRPEESYNNIVLQGIIPGAMAYRWTDDYDLRDAAVRLGISPANYDAGSLVITDLLTFYHPASVSINNNGYRDQRNVAILQNILYNSKANWAQDKWNGISIVADIAKVTNATAKAKARDRNSVLMDVIALVKSWEGLAWLYSAAYTLNRLSSDPTLITIRSGGRGFDIKLPVIFSGNGTIIDCETQFDTSLTAILG